MKLKIKVTTPKGYTKDIENNLVMKTIRTLILGKNKAKHSILTDEKNDFIIWEIEAEPRRALKIDRNVAIFHMLMQNIGSHKLMKSAMKMAKLPPEEQQGFKDLLINQTKVEVVKEC